MIFTHYSPVYLNIEGLAVPPQTAVNLGGPIRIVIADLIRLVSRGCFCRGIRSRRRASLQCINREARRMVCEIMGFYGHQHMYEKLSLTFCNYGRVRDLAFQLLVFRSFGGLLGIDVKDYDLVCMLLGAMPTNGSLTPVMLGRASHSFGVRLPTSAGCGEAAGDEYRFGPLTSAEYDRCDRMFMLGRNFMDTVDGMIAQGMVDVVSDRCVTL